VICRAIVKAKQGNPGWMAVRKIRWWKLDNKALREKFIEEAREVIRSNEQSWEQVSQAVREIGRKVVGVTSGNSKYQKETWWWNEEVKKAVDIKREKRKARDGSGGIQVEEYKEACKVVKRKIAEAQGKVYEDLYNKLNLKEGQKAAIRIAKSKNKNSADILQPKIIKDDQGKTLVNDAEIRERWRKYFEQLMNVENPRMEKNVVPNGEEAE